MKSIDLNKKYNDNSLERLKQIEEARIINEGLKDVKAGRVIDGDKALVDLKEKYSL